MNPPVRLPKMKSSGAECLDFCVCVALHYSEMVPGTDDIEQRYWDLLRQVPVIGGIGVFSRIELAYALGRMFTILTGILPGNDPEVRRLASRIGLNPSKIRIGSLPLNDFIAAVFGLFAYGWQLKGPEHAIFDVRRIFAKVGFPSGILRRLVNDHALSAMAFRKRVGGGAPRWQCVAGHESHFPEKR